MSVDVDAFLARVAVLACCACVSLAISL